MVLMALFIGGCIAIGPCIALGLYMLGFSFPAICIWFIAYSILPWLLAFLFNPWGREEDTESNIDVQSNKINT